MCDLDYGYMGFTRNIIKIKGKTIQYTDMSLESACENENNVLLLNSFSSNIYTQGDVHVKGTNSYMNVKKQINVKPNTTYVVSVNIESINKGDNNYSPKLQIKKGSTIICSTNSSATFNSGDNTTLDVAMYVNSAIVSTTECEANFKNIKIQEKNEIQLPQPLRSLPNGVCDTIEGNKLVQRVGKVIITKQSNVSWSYYNTNLYGLILFVTNISAFGLAGSGDNKLPSVVSDNFVARADSEWESEKNPFRCFMNRNGKIHFLMDEAEFPTVTEFNNWLEENPTTVYYQLQTPIEHTIDINIKKIKKSKCYNKIKPTII